MNGVRTALAGLGLAGMATGLLLAARARDVCATSDLRAYLDQTNEQTTDRFCPEMVAELPEPARRYFLHAMQPGTPLAHVVRLTMGGEMRLGPEQGWLPFRASQVLAPPTGFVWEVSAGRVCTQSDQRGGPEFAQPSA